MTRTTIFVLGLGAFVGIALLVKPPTDQHAGTTTYREDGAPTITDAPRRPPVLASGGLACRSRQVYLRNWKKVVGFTTGGGGHDSLEAWARRLPGCRTLDMEGEPVDRLELVSRSPQVAEVWLVGDTLPWFTHWAAIDTVPAAP